jgi:phosphatidylglycerol lysyltransferase
VTPFTRDAREVLVALNVPLPLIEASHFLGSVAGLGLLVVARGLLHRLDAAWWAALGPRWWRPCWPGPRASP